MSNVLLLRNPSTDAPDRYESSFKDLGYSPISVPVLETTLTNVDQLKRKIFEGPARREGELAGVIIMSARACEAWKTVVAELASTQCGHGMTASWTRVPFYVVGEATASALAEISLSYPDSPFAPKDIRGAKEAGTSERLAHFILKDISDLHDSRGNTRRTMFYLTGDKSLDTLPKILKDGGVDLESLQIYSTQGSSTFESDLRRALKAGLSINPDICWGWIAFFAPSAADFVLPVLHRYFKLSRSSTNSPHPVSVMFRTEDMHPLPHVRIACIGPTTAAHVEEKLHVHVDVMAPKPGPEMLASAIARFDQEQLISAPTTPLSSQTACA